jgi:hypothetical protein
MVNVIARSIIRYWLRELLDSHVKLVQVLRFGEALEQYLNMFADHVLKKVKLISFKQEDSPREVSTPAFVTMLISGSLLVVDVSREARPISLVLSQPPLVLLLTSIRLTLLLLDT